MKKQQKITRYIGLLFFLFVYFVSPRVVSAVACTGLPSIGDLSLSNCILTVAGTTGSDQAGNIEGSTTNTADLLLSTGASVTINATGTLAVGSISPQGGSIAIENGGQIKLNTPLYIPDADADGWASDFSTVYTATSSGRRRLSLMRSAATTDCGDSTYATNNVCCTVATRYQDADGDGYGNPSVSISACTTAGYVDNNTDCNDSNAGILGPHTANTERTANFCNGACNQTRYLYTATECADNYYAANTLNNGCSPSHTANQLRNDWFCNGACNMTRYYYSSTECADTYYASNANNNGCSPSWTYYRDADGDGYGSASSGTTTCCSGTCPGGYVSNNSDCYDGNASAYPGSGACSGGNRGDGSFDWNCSGGASACGTGYYGTLLIGYHYRGGCGTLKNGVEMCCYDPTTSTVSSGGGVGCGGGGYTLGGYYQYGDASCGSGGDWYYALGGYGVQACQ